MRKKESKLEKVIQDSFASRAEQYSSIDLLDYFIPPPKSMDFRSRYHHFIVGRKGTGKTMILKNLSSRTQLSRKIKEEVDIWADLTDDYCGFYLMMPPKKLPAVNPSKSLIQQRLFDHWINISILKSIVEDVIFFSSHFDVSVPKDVSDILHELLKSDLPSELKDLESFLVDLRNQTMICLRELGVKKIGIDDIRENLSSNVRYGGKLTTLPDFLYDICESLVSPLFGDAPIFFLLDEFEKIPKTYQEYLLDVISWRSNQPYFVKIGSRYWKDFEIDLPPDKIDIIDIEDFDPEGKRYKTFSKKVLDQRCKSVCDLLSEEFGISYKKSEKASEALLPNTDRSGVYAGVNEIIKLSSGFIRYVIELGNAILLRSLSSDPDLSKIGSVPVDVQDRAIHQRSEEQISQELVSDIGFVTSISVAKGDYEKTLSEFATTFLQMMLSKFSSSSEFNNKILIEGFPKGDYGRLAKELIKGYQKLGVVTGTNEETWSQVYKVNLIYSPSKDLPLRISDDPLQLSANQVNWMLKPRRPPKSESGSKNSERIESGKMEELFPEEITCFFSSVHDNDLSNKKRALLREKVFPEFNLTYIDSDEVRGSKQRTQRLKNLVDDSEVLVYDLPVLNSNLCFMYGLGLALAEDKPFFFIRNTRSQQVPENRPEFLQVKTDLHYTFPVDNKTFRLDAKIEKGRLSLERVFEKIRGHAEENSHCFPMKDLNLESVLDQSARENTAFIYAPKNSPLYKWKDDLSEYLKNELSLNIYPLEDYDLENQHQIVKYLLGIARSKHHIIDTTNNDLDSMILLGFSYGLKSRPFGLAWSESVVSNNLDFVDLDFSYNSKDSLFSGIKGLLQE